MADVVLAHVGKTYANGVQAVHDISLKVADGEFVVIVGPSGSGKTTTLRLIAGLEQPTTGTIRIADRLANALAPRDRDVAMVFQRHSLYPHLSVRGNLAFGLRLRQHHSVSFFGLKGNGPSRMEQRKLLAERVAETAAMLGLEGVLDRLPEQLSGGQQQRAALGRALVRRPAVLLLDEPLSNLDAPLRAEIRRQLHLLHRRLQATIIYVTHDQIEALTLGERVMVLDRGMVQQVDRPAALYDHPCNRFVAGFIGWPTMNFLDGQLKCADGDLRFEAQGWDWPVPHAKAGMWAPFAGRPVTLGTRPEHVLLSGNGLGSRGVGMEVAWVEPLGNDTLVTLQRDDWELTARVAGRVAAAQGQTVEVTIDMGQSHLFDRASGLALDWDSPSG